MRTRTTIVAVLAVGVASTAALSVGGSPAAAAESRGPTITVGVDEETFFDDWLYDLCGVEADVTVEERWMLKEFPDGSEALHTVRTYTSSDPRIPLEKGSATSFNAPDGSRVVAGTPLHLFDPDGGTMILDAGRIAFDPGGDVLEVRGPHTFLDVDPADLYCP
jgi:hypothetical protein